LAHAIFYHFPIDTGYVIGDDEHTVSGIIDQIQKQPGKMFGNVVRRKVEMVRLEAPEDYVEPEYVPLRQPIVVELVQVRGIRIPIEGLVAEVGEADISIFPMGIAIGHIKFTLESTKRIGSRDLYLMESAIFWNVRSLMAASPESELSAALRASIEAIKRSIASFFAESGMAPLPRTPSKKVDYFYPLYYVDGPLTRDEVRNFLCLLYMRPSNESISSEELEKALNSNASIFSSAWLITGGEGAIMAGSEFSGAKGDSYSRALEVVGYVWYTMFILDAYLSTQLKELTKTPPEELTLRKSEDQLSRIRQLRALIHDTLEEYRNIRVSLWASVIRIFDAMFQAGWDVNRIEESVNRKLELIDYIYRDITDGIERTYNFEMNRAIFVLQRSAFALAGALGIVPLLITALRTGMPFWPPTTEWIYPILGTLILVLTVFTSSRIAQFQWERRSRRIRYI
jgi:hypothetical protein